MNDNSHSHSAAELQREIEADRHRIEEKLHAIEERMSPGQLMDELLEYARQSGGAEYVSNLGKALRTNPIPVTLLGVSLAWLFANPGTRSPGTSERDEAQEEYPLATVTGAVRRTGPVEASFGERYSHFTDEGGNRFRALTDAGGRRAGHFVDQSGKAYRGFADAAGKQVKDIRDEAGTLFDGASGWASDTWRQVSTSTGRLTGSIAQAGSSVAGSVQDAARTFENRSAQFNDAILRHFRDQPLVGGALAFAVGAAIGAALPHTELEDQAVGDVSDKLRGDIISNASEAAQETVGTAREVLNKAGDGSIKYD
ncbi:DUF3618 domain-containing protein (plasmid) [Rhizobium sp. CB3090]|uniref:DUF3618 domain-containing protein n=1 Tax=Rhizobium sp. CB3090 TaxID=3039156 RepID=UPI0024B12282|nr:DUF3618 domain-containing protein [Rhizobium sp. CB3090]WFU12323.1 DUF3618 domain-containing protein [Rhizobium sp. CB3090]